jgi:hypothetical protein
MTLPENTTGCWTVTVQRFWRRDKHFFGFSPRVSGDGCGQVRIDKE